MCHGVFGGGVSACRGLNEQLRGCRHSRGPVHRVCGGRWRISAATLGNFLRKEIFGHVRQFLTSNRALIEVRVNGKQDASFTWSAPPRPSDSLKAVKTGARVSITVCQNSLWVRAIASTPVDACTPTNTRTPSATRPAANGHRGPRRQEHRGGSLVTVGRARQGITRRNNAGLGVPGRLVWLTSQGLRQAPNAFRGHVHESR